MNLKIIIKKQTMNKHKEFIKECYEGKYGSMCSEWKGIIEIRYPEFKEEKMKVGEWMINNRGRNYPPRLIEKVDNNSRRYSYTYKGETKMYSFGYARKATKEEIESHLIEEAKRRGFKDGVFFTGLRDVLENEVEILSSFGFTGCSGHKKERAVVSWFDYKQETDTLYALGYGRYVVYEKGQWAEIIPTMTKEEAEQKLNCKII